ncbi:cysteine-rich receptor-like protein kinase 10 [Hevea brasiliensis]|uniref:cysteine-rich receptor-like protein kinase 10 n=1 Tax=Hevea brasiliensis TaxID=3981 RepID=UPI0025DAFDCB|nr:cysteine-rich receptor-like protein kinase 10 [Hevea brasiliensis]
MNFSITVVLMLNGYSVTLPVPRQPAFVLNSRSGQSLTFKALESDQSTSKSAQWSVDEASITEEESGEGKSSISAVTIVAIVAPISIFIVLFCMGYCFLRRRARQKSDTLPEDGGNEISTVESLQFDPSIIEAATNNFTDDNKLGEGGFGDVYKVILPNGQEIAVKRLSRSSGQGAVEFKNEVLLLAKLQQRNLVRLIGFCLEGEERILVYEFVPNKSLDYFLFGQDLLNIFPSGSSKHIMCIESNIQVIFVIIARLIKEILLSLYQRCSVWVVFNGYASPEYAMHGQFSVKSDMYSFGFLVLKILSGKKNSSFYQIDGADDLESYEDPADRTTMGKVVLMLISYSVTLPVPQRPAFVLNSRSGQSFTLKALESDQSTSKSLQWSVDEASITEEMFSE